MNFRTTVVLLVILAVFGGAYLYVSKAHPAAEEGKPPTLLGAFDQAQVEKLRVDNQERGYRVEFVRQGPDAWKMTYPLEDAPADEALLSQILSAVAYNTRKPAADLAPGGSGLEAYGLAKPRAVLDFEMKGTPGKAAARLRLLVGGEDIKKDDILCGVGPPVEAGKEGEWRPTGIVRTPANVWNSVNKTVDQYRDPRVFSVRTFDAQSLEVFRDNERILALGKEDNAWQLRAPRRERADRFVADAFVSQVLGWRIARFHENAPGPDENYGLNPPRIEIVVHEGSEKTERLLIGKEVPEGVLAKREGSKFIWALKAEDVKAIEKNPEDFLDRKLFRHFSDEVNEVRIGRAEGEVVLAREGAGSRAFRLKPKDLATAADQTDALLADLEKLEIAGFEAPIGPPGDTRPASGPALDEALKRYGLDAAPRWIQVGAKGKPTKVLVGKREGEILFVRRDGSANVGRMKAEEIERILSRDALHFLAREVVSFSEFDLSAIEIEAKPAPETQPADPATRPAGATRKARWSREEGGKWMRQAAEGTASAPAEDPAFTKEVESIVRLKGDEARAWTAEGFPFEEPLLVVRYWKGSPTSRPAVDAAPTEQVKVAEKDGASVALAPSGVVFTIPSDLVARLRALP